MKRGGGQVARALALGDASLLRLALAFEPATPAHLQAAMDLPDRARRLAACRLLVEHGANPWQGDPHAIATAVARGRQDEAWSMQAAWRAHREETGEKTSP